MTKYIEVLSKCKLFYGLSPSEISSATNCIGASVVSFKKNNDIFFDGTVKMGILLCGNLQNVQTDFFGNHNIIANFEPSDVFGEALVCAEVKNSPIQIVATTDSEVMFLQYEKILTVCNNACSFHLTLLHNILKLIAQKNLALNGKLLHVTKRTTKQKVLSYLSEQSRLANSSSFTIPFDRQALADYLSVERSALSVVLSQLEDEKILTFKKNHFILL